MRTLTLCSRLKFLGQQDYLFPFATSHLKLYKMFPLHQVKCFFNISKGNSFHSNIRHYSRYAPHYSDPISDEGELQSIMQARRPPEIKLMHIKAAKHNATCSVFFDPDVDYLKRRLLRNGNFKLANQLVESTFQTIKTLQLEKYYSASEESKHKIELDPVVIFHKAIENATPLLTTKMVVKSGTPYNIPTMISPKRAKFLAFKFLIEAANVKDRIDRFYKTLAVEIIKASENKGRAVQTKVDLHKYCEANRAYAHYRWT